MQAQITVTVAEGKRLIAEAISQRADVQGALAAGRILLKGGTTVSAVLERLAGEMLRISGRISPRGAKAAARREGGAHSAVLEHGQLKNIDTCFSEVVQSLGKADIAVIGANAIDSAGRAALMFGSPLGGMPGCGLAGLMAQGCKIIIACGLEKLIPTSIDSAVRAAGMRSMDWSMGMAVGLAPIIGELVTEPDAIGLLADVECCVIGAGGIDGAEGALTMVVAGEEAEIEKIVKIVLALKQTATSGQAGSLVECTPGKAAGCGIHRACAWRAQKGENLQWVKK